ncbi:MAG: hypothetical protein RL226_2263 [Bacteroidota bacterium]|jgi:hypothetical protein
MLRVFPHSDLPLSHIETSRYFRNHQDDPLTEEYMNTKTVVLVVLGFVAGYVTRMLVSPAGEATSEPIEQTVQNEPEASARMAFAMASPDTTLSTLIPWATADSLVTRFHRSNHSLRGMFPKDYVQKPGDTTPKLKSWFVDRASLEYCLRMREDSTIPSGVRIYPVVKTINDGAGRPYDYHSLVVVGTQVDSTGLVHNNILEAFAADDFMCCPVACLNVENSKLGDD